MTGRTGERRIAAAFAAARSEGRAALMPYLMGGFPDGETAAAVAEAYADSGADLVELGIPYSDPLADGPVIHAAATEALAAGATLDSVLAIGERIAGRVPVVAMIYANMVLAAGADRIADRLATAGAAGTIVPDLPIEEAAELREALAAHGVALIPLVAPTTPPERRTAICAVASGFVYVVSLTGVTGERDELPAGLGDLLAAVRDQADVPVAVGFGIATPQQAAAVGRVADGVIIGSRLVRAVGEAGSGAGAPRAAAEFLAAVREALGG